MRSNALIVVDMLYDFIDGSLACHNAQAAVQRAKKHIEEYTSVDSVDEDGIADTMPVIFICDHHPKNHCSFKENGGIWPPHCVIGTRGAEIHDDLKPFATEELTFFKAFTPDADAYSGYGSCNSAGQTLAEVLELMGITDCIITGIATEYCVKETVEDLFKAGYKIHILFDSLGCVNNDEAAKVLKALQAEGMEILM